MIVQQEITEVIPESRRVLKKAVYACDICGVTANQLSTQDTVRWGTNSFEVRDTSVIFNCGEVYPGTGAGTKKSIHICPKCFETELLPFMKARSKVNFEVTETYWEL